MSVTRECPTCGRVFEVVSRDDGILVPREVRHCGPHPLTRNCSGCTGVGYLHLVPIHMDPFSVAVFAMGGAVVRAVLVVKDDGAPKLIPCDTVDDAVAAAEKLSREQGYRIHI